MQPLVKLGSFLDWAKVLGDHDKGGVASLRIGLFGSTLGERLLSIVKVFVIGYDDGATLSGQLSMIAR